MQTSHAVGACASRAAYDLAQILAPEVAMRERDRPVD